jgi:hypothetical protein
MKSNSGGSGRVGRAMTVKKQRKIIIENKCNCIVGESLLIKAMIWYAGRPQCSKKTIFLHGRYPAVGIFHEKIHVHRLIMLFLNRSHILKGIVSHHKDGNCLNATVDNLELMPHGIHASLHNKGKVLTLKHRAKIAENNRLRKGIPHKEKVHIDLNLLKKYLSEGMSINKCARYFKCDWTTIRKRIHDNPEIIPGGKENDKRR